MLNKLFKNYFENWGTFVPQCLDWLTYKSPFKAIERDTCALGGVTVLHKLGTIKFTIQKFEELHILDSRKCIGKAAHVLPKSEFENAMALEHRNGPYKNFHKHYTDTYLSFFTRRF